MAAALHCRGAGAGVVDQDAPASDAAAQKDQHGGPEEGPGKAGKQALGAAPEGEPLAVVAVAMKVAVRDGVDDVDDGPEDPFGPAWERRQSFCRQRLFARRSGGRWCCRRRLSIPPALGSQRHQMGSLCPPPRVGDATRRPSLSSAAGLVPRLRHSRVQERLVLKAGYNRVGPLQDRVVGQLEEILALAEDVVIGPYDRLQTCTGAYCEEAG